MAIVSAGDRLFGVRDKGCLGVLLFFGVVFLVGPIGLEALQILLPAEKPNIIDSGGGEFERVKLIEADRVEKLIVQRHILSDHGLLVHHPIP